MVLFEPMPFALKEREGLMAVLLPPPDQLISSSCIFPYSSSTFTISRNDLGQVTLGNTPTEFAEVIKAETAYWARVVKDAGISPIE
jgi:hypothetical protein